MRLLKETSWTFLVNSQLTLALTRKLVHTKSKDDFIKYINSTSPYKLLGIVDELSNIREQHPEFFI